MSPDAHAARRRFAWLAAAVALAVLAWWLAGPRWIGGLDVESARVVAPAAATPDGRPAPARIAVTFSVPRDLARTRERLGMGYIEARLSACGDSAYETGAVATQDMEYRTDEGRVRQLPPQNGRARYQAVFDDQLTALVDHQFVRRPALGRADDLCFRLWGARMGPGFALSRSVELSQLRASPPSR